MVSTIRRHPWLVLFPLLCLLTVFSLAVGRFAIPLGELGRFLLAFAFGDQFLDEPRYQAIKNVVLEIRLPRALAAILIGASLAASGAAFQALFRNPLVSPGLLGVLAGAAFGAAIGMVASQRWLIVQLSAFTCGLLAVGLAVGIARIYRIDSLLILLLGGIISGALFTSLLSVVKFTADPYNQLPSIVYWLMGGLAKVESGTVAAVVLPMSAGIVALIVLSRYMNALSMGDEEARALGIHVGRIRLAIILSATLISALTVVLAGVIGWVGLVIPHIARLVVGPDNERLLPSSALIGAMFLLLADDVSRTLSTVEIPVGIVTELVGIPVFLVVLRNVRRGWGV